MLTQHVRFSLVCNRATMFHDQSSSYAGDECGYLSDASVDELHCDAPETAADDLASVIDNLENPIGSSTRTSNGPDQLPMHLEHEDLEPKTLETAFNDAAKRSANPKVKPEVDWSSCDHWADFLRQYYFADPTTLVEPEPIHLLNCCANLNSEIAVLEAFIDTSAEWCLVYRYAIFPL